MACSTFKKFKLKTKYPHKRSEGLRKDLRLERIFAHGGDMKFIAHRVCPQCKKDLVKTDPAAEVKCQCGWVWR